MKKKVLIVVGSYAPAMVADMHRARVLSWELPAIGWDVEILAPDVSYQLDEFVESDCAEFFAPGTRVHHAQRPGWLMRLFWSIFRSSTIGWKALFPLNSAAKSLLKSGTVDLVFISTAKFPLFLLGWWWRISRGLPYVLDIHDPIYRPHSTYFGGISPGFKRSLSHALLWLVERVAVVRAAGLISVSAEYLETFVHRYARRRPPWLHNHRRIVIPFAAAARDLDIVARMHPGARPRDQSICTVVYIGAGGAVMRTAFRSFCCALHSVCADGLPSDLRIAFRLYGTMYGWREGQRKDLQDIANELGVGQLVREEPARVTYRKSLELLLDSDGVLVLGVDDTGYMPSKLYTCALAAKPLLAIFRRSSVAALTMLERPGLGHLITFDPDGNDAQGNSSALCGFLREVAGRQIIDRQALLSDFLPANVALRHARFFDTCLGEGSTGTP